MDVVNHSDCAQEMVPSLRFFYSCREETRPPGDLTRSSKERERGVGQKMMQNKRCVCVWGGCNAKEEDGDEGQKKEG